MASVVTLGDVSLANGEETAQLGPATGGSERNARVSTADDVIAEPTDRERDGRPVTDCDVTVRKPRRILHFCDGTLEEFSTDDEDDARKAPPAASALVDPKQLQWIPFMWYHASKVGNKALEVCDYIGEHLASFLGITSPKYSVEIEEYHKMKREEQEEEKKAKEENAGWQRESVPLSDVRKSSSAEDAVEGAVVEAPRY